MALEVDLAVVGLRLLAVQEADSFRVSFYRLPILLQGLEAVSDTKLSSEGLPVLQLDELLEVFECEIELFVQE